MATINWHGAKVQAAPVKQLTNGDWLMRALEPSSRFIVGTMIQVKKDDVISLEDDGRPDPVARAAELEAAMVQERKGLPSVMELLQKLKNGNAAARAALDADALARAEPLAPTAPSPPIARQIPPTQDDPNMSKLSALADLAASTTKDIEAEADRASARLVTAKAKAMGGIAKLDGVSAEIEKGVAAVEDLANQLSNGGPPLGK